MSNKPPIIYTFPKQIEREFHQLIQSRWDFSEKLLPAEKAKLKILYERLQGAWNLNTTEVLSKNLDLSYQELRETQAEISQDWKNYEQSIEEELKENIQTRLQRLKRTKDNSTLRLEQLKRKLGEKTQNWSNDILQRKEELKIEEQKLENLSNSAEMLKEHRERLTESRGLLERKSEQLKSESMLLSETEETFQSNMNDFITKNNQDLKMLQQELEKQKKASQMILSKESERLNQDLKQIEKEQLRLLRAEIAEEIPNCLKELKEYLQQGELSLISMKEKTLIRETEQLTNALWTGLTRVGLDRDLYFEKVDEFIMGMDNE